MKKTIQRILITVLVFSFILVPTSKVEAAKYPYTDYLFDDIGAIDTYVGHTVAAVAHGATLDYKTPKNSFGYAKSIKVKNSKIASAKLAKIPKGKGFDTKLDRYVVVTGKKVGVTQVTVTYQSGYKVTTDIEVFSNYISKSVRVRGKKISIGESLAQVKKDFGTKFKVIKDKGMKGKYLAYTDDMSKFFVVGICKDKVVEIYTTSSDWKSGNIGFGVKDTGKKYEFMGEVGYHNALFADYRRVSSGIDKYVHTHPLQFILHDIRSCSTSLDEKPRIYYLYRALAANGKYSLESDYSTRHNVYDLLEKGAKAAAKSKGFTIQFTTDMDTI